MRPLGNCYGPETAEKQLFFIYIYYFSSTSITYLLNK